MLTRLIVIHLIGCLIWFASYFALDMEFGTKLRPPIWKAILRSLFWEVSGVIDLISIVRWSPPG